MPSSNRPLRALIAVFGVIFAVVALAGPAHAMGPYNESAATSVSDPTPEAGASIEFCGTGFQPGETVSISLESGTEYPSVTADSDGDFCTTVKLPDGLSGEQTLTAVGETSGATSSQTLEVGGDINFIPTPSTPTTAGSGGVLAATGATVISIGSLAVLLVLGGVLMVFSSRRRKVNG